MLNAMREAPVSMSDPTIDSNSPSTIIAIALSTEPFASTTAKIRPAGEEGSDRGDRQRGTRPALLGHLEAVERGDD
jgi:hypothetical protein